MNENSSDAISTPDWQYGVMFRDGSVRCSWNGRTQLQRATEDITRLKEEYKLDAPYFKLVRRKDRDSPWEEFEEEFDA